MNSIIPARIKSLFEPKQKLLLVLLILFALSLFYYYPVVTKPLSVPSGHDMVSYYYPNWMYIQNRFVENSAIPLWNDSIVCGTTIIGNAHFSLFYPPNWLFLFLPVSLVFNLWFIFHVFIAGIGMYLLLRYFNLETVSSFFGSVIFMFGGHLAVRINIGHYHIFSSIALIPLTYLYFIKFLDKSTFRNFLKLSAMLALQLLTLHLQIFYFITISIGFYTLLFLFMQRGKGRVPNSKFIKTISGLFMAFLLSVGICAAQLLPVLEATLNSHRVEHTYKIFSKLSLPFNQLAGVILPDLWGSDSKYIGAINYWELSAFMGFIILLPLIFGFRRKSVHFRIFTWLSILSLIIAMGKYLPTGIILFKLPFMSFGRIPARFIVIFAFCIAVLSAAGLQRIITAWRSDRKETVGKLLKILAVFLLILIILLVASFLIPKIITKTFYHASNIGKDDLSKFFTPVLLYAVSIIILFAIFLLLGKRLKIKPEYIALFFIAVSFAELTHYNHKILKPRYADELADGYSDLKPLTKDQNELFRINGAELKHQLGLTLNRIDNARGYEALKNRYFHDITRIIKKKLSLTSSEFYHYSLKLSRLMNIKYQIVRRGKIKDEDFIPKAKIDLRGESYKVYSSLRALPRAYFTNSVYEGESLSDFYNFVVTDKYLDTVFYSVKLPSEKNIFLRANILAHSPISKLLTIDAPVDGILVLSEAYFPGWKVTVDGNERDMLRVNYAFLGVKISKGTHSVNFYYRPSTLNIGIIISFITLAGFFICLLILRKNHVAE